ncbi:MAG: AAA family ATPase [Planctomycetales bacterium]|nr:AAA family ATPase [Planctomycetales bacterium]
MKPEHYTDATEFEKALFGAAILAPTMLDEVSTIVSSADFHLDHLGRAFALMTDMHASGLPIGDVRLLVAKLRQARLLDAIGGAAFVAEAANSSHAHHATWYAVKVRELAQLRSLERAGEILTAEVNLPNAEPNAIRESVEARLEAIQQTNASGDIESLDEMVTNAIAEIREARQRGDSLGLPSGLVAVDEATGGFFNGDLTILAARTSVGKSALAIDIAARLAEKQRQVFIVSLEMSGKQIAHRFLSRETGIPVKSMQRGDLSVYQETRIIEAKERLKTYSLKAFPTSFATVSQIRARAKIHKAQHGLDFLIVDYLGLIEGNKHVSTYERITGISRELKQLAMHIERPVLCLAQLNREAAKAGVPSLSHLRDSGAIEQDADNVWLLHRDDLAAADTKLIIAKQRQGCVGTIPLTFNADRMSFSEPSIGYSEWTGVEHN